MKINVTFLICIAIGIGIGWYVGYTRLAARNQRGLLEEYQYPREHFHELDSDIADFRKRRAEYFEAAKPYAASSASIALGALKDLDANDLESARSKLAAMVAIYYRGHSRDGDTNLLASIANFAATNSTLSNAVYGKFQ